MLYEYWLFLQAFFKEPKRVGNIVPSSKSLANKVVQSVEWNNVNTIAELGAGTGAITRLITSQMKKSATLFLFERNRNMREYLKAIYPKCIFHSNARALRKKINQENICQLDCIICGLPFFNFSSVMRGHIIDQIVGSLRPNGLLVTYQHSLHMKRKWAEQLIIENIELVPGTFPPTFIYVARKK